MSEFTVKTSGFARLNGVLGVTTPPIPYAWDGSEVLLQSGEFDATAYIDSKLDVLMKRDTGLPSEAVQSAFQQTIQQNKNLIFDMHSCTPELFKQYDAKFNLLLEAAIGRVEHEHYLQISRENIKNSLQIEDSWMTFTAVNNLAKLTSSNPAQAPDPRKFVPKHRR